MATSVGGVLATERFINTSHAIKKDVKVQLALDSPLQQDWFSKGCYNRPRRKPTQRMTAALKKDLEEMFQKGLQTNAKISAVKTVTYLTELRSPDGRLKYSFSANNPNGPPPDVNRVKQYFSTLSIKQKKGPVEKEEKVTIPMLEMKLQERLLPYSGLAVLKAILWFCDRVHITADEENEKEEEVDYLPWKGKQLEAEIARRELDIKTKKDQLIMLLELFDLFKEEQDTIICPWITASSDELYV